MKNKFKLNYASMKNIEYLHIKKYNIIFIIIIYKVNKIIIPNCLVIVVVLFSFKD